MEGVKLMRGLVDNIIIMTMALFSRIQSSKRTRIELTATEWKYPWEPLRLARYIGTRLAADLVRLEICRAIELGLKVLLIDIDILG